MAAMASIAGAPTKPQPRTITSRRLQLRWFALCLASSLARLVPVQPAGQVSAGWWPQNHRMTHEAAPLRPAMGSNSLDVSSSDRFEGYASSQDFLTLNWAPANLEPDEAFGELGQHWRPLEHVQNNTSASPANQTTSANQTSSSTGRLQPPPTVSFDDEPSASTSFLLARQAKQRELEQQLALRNRLLALLEQSGSGPRLAVEASAPPPLLSLRQTDDLMRGLVPGAVQVPHAPRRSHSRPWGARSPPAAVRPTSGTVAQPQQPLAPKPQSSINLVIPAEPAAELKGFGPPGQEQPPAAAMLSKQHHDETVALDRLASGQPRPLQLPPDYQAAAASMALATEPAGQTWHVYDKPAVPRQPLQQQQQQQQAARHRQHNQRPQAQRGYKFKSDRPTQYSGAAQVSAWQDVTPEADSEGLAEPDSEADLAADGEQLSELDGELAEPLPPPKQQWRPRSALAASQTSLASWPQHQARPRLHYDSESHYRPRPVATHQVVHIHESKHEKRQLAKYLWPIVGGGLTMLMGFLIISNMLLSIPLLAMGASALWQQNGPGLHSQQLVPVYNLSQMTTRAPTTSGRRRRRRRRRWAPDDQAAETRLAVKAEAAPDSAVASYQPRAHANQAGRSAGSPAAASSAARRRLEAKLGRLIGSLVVGARRAAARLLSAGSWSPRQVLKAAYCRRKPPLVLSVEQLGRQGAPS